MAGVRRAEDFIAWQLAEKFAKDVESLIAASPDAGRDYRYRDQLLSAATAVGKDIVEGFLRFSPLVFANFLDYALGSLGEAEGRLRDGVSRQYFSEERCRPMFLLARRCLTALVRLKQSQIRYARKQQRRSHGGR